MMFGIGAVLLGCAGDLRDVDRRVDRLLAGRSGNLGGGAVAPERTFPEPDLPSRRALSDRDPPSNNPAASELRFDPAAADRDFASRLRALQDQTAIPAIDLDLVALWRQAQKTAREHLTAEEEYILRGIGLLVERHQWSPRLFGTTSLAAASGPGDGDSATVLNLINELGVRQRLPFGGQAAASWVWNASENLRTSSTGQYRQSSALVLDGSIPLLRGAGMVAQESRIQAERDLVYAARGFEDFRRQFLVSLARDYFNLLQQQDGLEATERQLESLRSIRDQQQALYDAGRVPEFDVNLANNDVLSAESDLANARESLILALDRLRVRLGLPETERLRLTPFVLAIPQPDVTLERATEMALAYRLDYQNRRDGLDDTRRGVHNAINRLLPDLSLRGSVRLPTDDDEREGGATFELDDARYDAALTFEWPLDREEERLGLRAAIIGLGQAKRALEQFRDELVIDVRQRVREIERARFNLELAEQRVEINRRRLEEQEFKKDELNAQTRVDSANAMREAERARDQATTDLRNSVLDYLIATGTLRVARDGTFEPLPGMEGLSEVPAGNQPRTE